MSAGFIATFKSQTCAAEPRQADRDRRASSRFCTKGARPPEAFRADRSGKHERAAIFACRASMSAQMFFAHANAYSPSIAVGPGQAARPRHGHERLLLLVVLVHRATCTTSLSVMKL